PDQILGSVKMITKKHCFQELQYFE
ncbi:uncharacterized protein METZ01_LOCUS266774, partial [marine metagenome]